MGIDSDIVHEEDRNRIEDFECVICRMLCAEPKQCTTCKKFFCTECIEEWQTKNLKCPLKCSDADMVVNDLKDDELKNYLSIRILCDRGCNKHFPFADYLEHITTCQLPDCSADCNGKAKYCYEDKNTCSYNCLISKYPEVLENPLLDPDHVTKTFPHTDLSKNFPLIWDVDKSSTEIKIVNMNTFMSTSTDDFFHTIVSKVGIIGGLHRFEMDIGKSAFPLKIGVTKDPNTPSYREAFCDYESGFGIFTIGQTRNDSNASGLLFGERLDNTLPHKIKMELSMGEGKLKFKFDDKNHGAAFDEDALKEGPFYIALAVRQSIGETKVAPVQVF